MFMLHVKVEWSSKLQVPGPHFVIPTPPNLPCSCTSPTSERA